MSPKGHPWLAEALAEWGDVARSMRSPYLLSRQIGCNRWRAEVIWHAARGLIAPAERQPEAGRSREAAGLVFRVPPGLEAVEPPPAPKPEPSPVVEAVPAEPAGDADGETWVIVGDAHVAPGQDLWRFRALGELVAKVRPDVLVSVGDWTDVGSLSSYDVGTVKGEGRRYHLDCKAAHDSMAELEKGMGGYRCRRVLTLGNHEDRIDRAASKAPHLYGTIQISDLGYEAAGWDVVPYTEPWERQGVTVCHHLASGVMGKPIGGETPARSIIIKQHTSAIVGHLHTLDMAQRTVAGGRRLQAMVAGCFFDHRESYAGEANRLWWRGLVILRNVQGGSWDVETVSMDRLKAGRF